MYALKYACKMQLQVILIASAFSCINPITADVLVPRQSGCVMCSQVMPTCLACPPREECQVVEPLGCSECPKAQCVASSPDATPSTISSSCTSVTTGTSAASTTPAGTTVSTTSKGSSVGIVGSSTGTSTANALTTSSMASEAGTCTTKLCGVLLKVALGIAVPVMGLQYHW